MHRIIAFVVTLAVLLQPARAADIEPVLTRTDAVAGLPLVMPVRVVGAGQPRARVTLRFPDGREVPGSVAAVRLRARESYGWIDAGPDWEVLAPAQAVRADDASNLVWFVLADPPAGVVGQEIWLDGKPIALRWLPRPELLGMRLGFDPGQRDAGSLAHPWSSPLPEPWRSRPDLARELEPARTDPLRAWRATLATGGLFPPAEDRAVGLPPELLDPNIVARLGADAPIETRLLDAVRAQTAARWRVALARLWSADAALSLRVRHALAGGGAFSLGAAGEVVAPVWTANDRESSALLELMLDDETPSAERAGLASRWLAERPSATLWIVDDGAEEGEGIPPTIGAVAFAAGDAGAILMTPGDLIVRPVVLPSRFARTLRPPREAIADRRIVYRVLGENRPLSVRGAAEELRPPGLSTGPFAPDWTMSRFVGGPGSRQLVDASRVPDTLIPAEGVRAGGKPRARLVVRLPTPFAAAEDDWEVRIWIGPFQRSRAVIVIRGDGTDRVQVLPDADREIPLPEIARGSDRDGIVLDLVLPPEAHEARGLAWIGLEAVGTQGERFAWPHAMLPWQIEPARRAIDPGSWLGEFSD